MTETQKIVYLRNKTALSLLKCKNALIRCNWNIDDAYTLLRKEHPMPSF